MSISRLRIWLPQNTCCKKRHIVFTLTVSLVGKGKKYSNPSDGWWKKSVSCRCEVRSNLWLFCMLGNDPSMRFCSIIAVVGFLISEPLVALEEVCYPKIDANMKCLPLCGTSNLDEYGAPKATPACSGLLHIYQVRILANPNKINKHPEHHSHHIRLRKPNSGLQLAWKTLGSRTEILNLQESFLHISKGLGAQLMPPSLHKRINKTRVIIIVSSVHV